MQSYKARITHNTTTRSPSSTEGHCCPVMERLSFIVEVQNCSTPNEKSTYHKKDDHCYVAKPAKKMHASHKQARVHDTTVIDRNIIDVPYNYKKGGHPT